MKSGPIDEHADMYPNKQLRGFQSFGLKKSDIASMSEKEFEAFIAKAKKEYNRRNDFGGWLGQRRKYALIRKASEIEGRADQDFQKAGACPLLNAFYPKRRNKWRKKSKRSNQDLAVVNLTHFSFIDDPEGTIEKFYRIAKAESKAPALTLNFTDNICYDIAPYLVLSLITEDMPPILTEGKISSQIEKVLERVGLLERMQIVTNRPKEKSPISIGAPSNQLSSNQGELIFDEEDVWALPLVQRNKIPDDSEAIIATSRTKEEKTALNMLSKIESWIKQHNPEQVVTEDQRNNIKGILTEILDNASRHGSPLDENGDWFTLACLQKKKNAEGEMLVFCSFSVINIGTTIMKSLGLAPPQIIQDIEKYVSLHLNNEGTNRELLWTVAALQDSISRKDPNQEGTSATNGMGFMTALSSVFNPIFDSDDPVLKPSFTVISGNAWVNASFPYSQLETKPRGQRGIYFNNDNSPKIAPDPNYTKTLACSFPGTILSIRFVIGGKLVGNAVKES